MRLVTALTADASLLRKLLQLWDASGDKRNPFANVLITPLFAGSSTIELVRKELKEKRGSEVYFDSGGYYAQQGKIDFTDMYCRLRDYYKDNPWADWYVLPDHVPTSRDSLEEVERKVLETITSARLFYNEMPPYIQEKALPVVHGHTLAQVNLCLETYRDLGVTYVGFGSFNTGGKTNSINIADRRSAEMLLYVVQQLRNENIRVHTFGVSTPPVVYAFSKIGIYSFDSMAWLRSAGYGKVFLPFTRAYNVSHRSIRNSALTQEEFSELRLQTGHWCPFCESFETLRESRLYRALHNLSVLLEMAEGTNQMDSSAIVALIALKSGRYYKMFGNLYYA